MNYYEEKISIKQAQLEVAKAGFTQVANVYMQNVSADGVDYDYAKEMAERLNAGLALVKEIEEDIERFQKLLKEEKAKEDKE